MHAVSFKILVEDDELFLIDEPASASYYLVEGLCFYYLARPGTKQDGFVLVVRSGTCHESCVVSVVLCKAD